MTRSRGKSFAQSHVDYTDGGQSNNNPDSWLWSKGSQTMFKRFAIYLQIPVAFWPKHVFVTPHITREKINTVGQNSVRELSSKYVN